MLSDFAVSESEAFAAYEASAGGEEQAVAIQEGCAMSHEGWWKRSASDTASRIEVVDPSLGQVSVAGFFLGTHGQEEFAEFLITAGANEEVLGETVVQSPAFDADGLGPVFPQAEHLGLWCAFVGVGCRLGIVSANVPALTTLTRAQGERE